ncbi:MAG: Gfo/Idh/MocA family oxidoreductase [Bacteroidetes bacterium]|nr:Gfo/Idh/MocA family oxidoreductase [Bacteroidota bacterium]
MKNIVLIGAGQLGSRHLQALASCEHQLDIQVMDPSQDSLNIAESRFNEVASAFKGRIAFLGSVDQLHKKIDVAIVATNSKVRRLVVEQLVKHAKVENFVLEKFLFPNLEDYDVVAKLLEQHQIKTWVNCPRRMMPFYKAIKSELTGPVQFNVTGNSWGLGCNGIHMLDLFSYLTDRTDFELDHLLIDPEIMESKRVGYVEFTGTIRAVAGNNFASITSYSKEISPVSVLIQTPTARYSIQEGAETKIWISKLEHKWAWEEQTHKMLFQSQLTNKVVDALLSNGNCELTTFSESAQLHKLFLKNLLEFVRKQKKDQSINECLIT